MNCTWTIENLRRNSADGGVITVFWKCKADGVTDKYGNELFLSSAIELTPDPSSPDFVPFDSLTEEVVLAWVWSEIQLDVEEEMAQRFGGAVIPETALGTPWPNS
jgi:hypothetical protein